MKKNRHHAALRLCVNNSSSEESATPRSEQAPSSRSCQSPGTRLLVRHLRTCQSDAPIALATSAIVLQRSGEKMSMPYDRDTLSPLSRPPIPLKGQSVSSCYGMASDPDLRTIVKRRMKRLRAAAGMTQQDVADALRIEKEAYKHQENRGALPQHLQRPFALIFRITVDELLSPTPEPEAVHIRPPRKKPKRLRAA